MKTIKVLSFALLTFAASNLSPSPLYGKGLEMGSKTIDRGIMQAILAKEICSCTFNTDLAVGTDQTSAQELIELRKNECLNRSGLPISAGILTSLISVRNSEPKPHTVPVVRTNSSILGHILALRLNGKNQRFTAAYLGKGNGCRLLTDAEVASQRVVMPASK